MRNHQALPAAGEGLEEGMGVRAGLAQAIPAPQVVRVMDQLLSALAYAHERGVVHRDLKPANLMVGDRKSVV